ncbi:AAA family ATPase [Vibrio harveyi]
MTMIIKRLIVKNFKVFETLDISFDSDNLIVLDGPNGFGKSSFFDAIELLLTGSIRRYVELEKLTVDGRKQKSGCPWLFNKAKSSDWLSIKAEIQIGEETKFLERAASKQSLDNHKGLANLNIPLYELSSIEDSRTIEISDEIVYLSNILGSEYKRDFELFHYIEQEENTRILKQKDKERQSQIAHLFEIGDIQEKIDKIVLAHKSISKLCNKEASIKLDDLKNEWYTSKAAVLPIKESIPYERLITVTNQEWDQKNFGESAKYIEQWLSDNGEMFRLKRFLSHFSEYKKHLENIKLEENLLPQLELKEKFFLYGDYLSQQNVWNRDLVQYDSCIRYLEVFKKLVESIKNGRIGIPNSLAPLLQNVIIFKEFEKRVSELKVKIDGLDILAETLTELLTMRAQMIEVFNNFQSQNDPVKTCPTCGHNWDSVEELAKGIEKQSKTLKALLENQNKELTEELDAFKKNFQIPIEHALSSFVGSQRATITYKRSVVALTVSNIEWFESYRKKLEIAGVKYKDLLVKDFGLDAKEQLKKLEMRVKEKFIPVDESVIFSDFGTIFQKVFNKDLGAVDSISLDKLESKISYLRGQQAIFSSKLALECEKKYEQAKKKFYLASQQKAYIKKLKDIYESEKKRYLESIVKEIEILFHIYSGRLMQSYQQGLGIFIENDGNSISFNQTPGEDFDVVFSMSSGQLSALVLSFTLALNQRYAKNGLLLIDDPVQTLDEINVAGFIELLRTEFSDRQVILSTHEDRVSAYFRYKYKKFGFEPSRINFMDLSKTDYIDEN